MSPSTAFEQLADTLERRLESLADRYPSSVADTVRAILREQIAALRDTARAVSQSEWEQAMGDDL